MRPDEIEHTSSPDTGAPYNASWQNGDCSRFQNTGNLTLTVNGAVTTDGFELEGSAGSNLLIGGSTLTLALNTFLSDVANNITVTISAPLAGGEGTGLAFYGSKAAGASTITLSGANSYVGPTNFSQAYGGNLTVKAGVATSGATGAFGAPTNDLTLNALTTTLDLNGFSNGVGTLSGVGPITNSSASAATLTAGNGSTVTGTYTGTISGKVALVKTGTSTLVLGGTSTYTGGTVVQAGTLSLNSTSTTASLTGSGAVRVNSGATLTGTGVVGGALTVADGGTLLITTGRITAGGNVALGDNTGTAATAAFGVGGGSTSPFLELEVGTTLTLAHVQLAVNFSDSLGAASQVTYLLVDNEGSSAISGTFRGVAASLPAGDTYSLNYAYTGTALNGTGNGNDLAITIFAVPEPNSLALAACAAGLALLCTRRVRSRLAGR